MELPRDQAFAATPPPLPKSPEPALGQYFFAAILLDTGLVDNKSHAAIGTATLNRLAKE